MDCPFHVIALGKRRVEVQIVGTETPSQELQAKVDGYVEGRLPDLARQQQP
jgi:hypothetical protein